MSRFATARPPLTTEQTAHFLAAVESVVSNGVADAAVHQLWQTDKKPEHLRAALARAAFAMACENGRTDLAGWLHKNFAEHIKTAEAEQAAAAALKRDDTATAFWALDVLEGFVTTDKTQRKAYARLMSQAMETSNEKTVARIFIHIDEGHSTYLYRGALGGRIKNVMHVAEHCKNRGFLQQADLDTTLVIAARNGDAPLLSYLLLMGADADAHEGAALKRAADRLSTDGTEIIEMLLRAGANPRLAKKTLPDDMIPLVDRVADETTTHHLTLLQQVCGTPPTAESLRRVHPALGTSGLHYAAQHRVLAQILPVGLTADDMQMKNDAGDRVLDIVFHRQTQDDFFASARWTGRTDVLRQVAALLDDANCAALDIPQRLQAADLLTVRHQAQGLRLRLKPSSR